MRWEESRRKRYTHCSGVEKSHRLTIIESSKGETDMAKKIYLSAAAHATDNKTKCPVACSENTHCNQYMDKLETRLREVGFAVSVATRH